MSFTKRIIHQDNDFNNCEAVFAEIIVYAYYLRLLYEGIVRSLDIRKDDYDLRIEIPDGSFRYFEILSINPKIECQKLEFSVVGLAELPQGIQFPDSLKDKISYDADKQQLVFKGLMEEEKDELLKLSPESSYQEAIKKIFESSQEVTASDIKTHLQEPKSSVRQKILAKRKQLSKQRKNILVIELNSPIIADKMADFTILSSLSDGYKITFDRNTGCAIREGYDWSTSIFDDDIVENIKMIIYFSRGNYDKRKFILNPKFKGTCQDNK